MGERRRGESGEPGTGFAVESEEPNSLLQRAVAVLQSSYLDSTSQQGFQYSKAILVENDLFLSELRAFAQAKEAAGYSQEELQETFAFLLFEKEEEAKEVCQSGLRVNSSSISTLGDPAKGVYISKYSDCLQPRPWHHKKSGYIVICKLIKGKVRAISESSSCACPSPGYDCHVSSQTSCSSQYYVYEVSGDSAAERPRQVCPYIVLHRQRTEPPMSALAEQNHQAPFVPWQGQLSIGGHLLCRISLRSHFSCTIPAQLPPNLDIKHVMGLSDLRKKLPAAAFGKKNYTGKEVCFQGVYSSLYEVEISKKDQSKMDQLLEKLKEKDLAIIKYLQDQGFLILLTSSALAREDGLEPKEPVSLLALFLFSSPRALCPPVEKDPKNPKESRTRSGISLKITSVLPGLRYALRKATSSSWNSIQEKLQEYSRLDGNSIPIPAQEEGADPSQKFLQLQRYLSNPSAFTLGVSVALECLGSAGRNLGISSSSSSSSLNPAADRATKSFTSPIKPWGRYCRRKSSRNLGKNPSQAQTDAGEEESRGRRKPTTAAAVPKNPAPPGSCSGAMLKLANLQLPHGRKRGAEVLAAEIILKPQPEAAEKEIPAPDAAAVEAKRPKTQENLEKRKIPGAGKNKMQKNVENKAPKAAEKQQEQNAQPDPLCLSEPPRIPPLQGDSCEPHALNLLADLALSSCIPAFIPPHPLQQQNPKSDPKSHPKSDPKSHPKSDPKLDPKSDPKSDSKPNPKPDPKSDPKSNPKPDPKSDPKSNPKSYPKSDPKSDPKSNPKSDPKSDHRYHKKSPPSKAQSHPSTNSSPPMEKSSGILSVPTPAPVQESPEVTPHSIISAEHSYASPMPEDPRKSPDPKENPKSFPKNPPKNVLVGKVLPFRHQSCSSLPAHSRGSPRRKEDFSKRHTVNFWGDSIRVTCRWKGKYLFHLDSRYTNNSLEKAVVRALHGPCDPDLPDDVEGMKLILHTWVALFYRKPSKLLSSSRKVVEHINPKKFVSINSSSAFLELSDDSQDCFGLETCPADSGSDPDQTPSSSLDPSPPAQPEKSPADSQTDAAVDSTVSSSSGELPCREEEEEEEEQEPSSTSCAESLALQECSGEQLDVEGREQERVRGDCSGTSTAEEPVKEQLLDARITPSPSEEPSKSLENHGSPTPNSSTAPWTDPPCAAQEQGEQQEKQQEGGSGSGPGPPEDEEGMGDSGNSLGAEDGADPCDSVPSEGNPGSGEPGGATEEGEQPQEPPEHSGKEERREEEKEELEDELSFLDTVGLVLSESSDTEMECEQNPGNSAIPEQLGAPEEHPMPSPTSLASPCPDRSTPALSHGARPDPEETPPKQDKPLHRRDAAATPDSDTSRAGAASAAELGSPHSASGELLCPPESSPVGGAQPDSVTDSPAPAADTGSCSEQEMRGQAPSGSTECPQGQGVALSLSPDSSSPDGSVHPFNAAEHQHKDSPQAPSQSHQLDGAEADPSQNSLDAEQPNPAGNGFVVEEQQGIPCRETSSCREELDEPMAAGDGRGSPLDCTDTRDDSRAEQREEEAENMEIPVHHHLLESEPSSSSSREEISAIQEPPRDSAPASPRAGENPTVRGSVLCRLGKLSWEGGAAQLSVPAWDGSCHPSFSQELITPPAPCSPVGVSVPAESGSAPPSPGDPQREPEAAEPGSPLPEGLPGLLPPTPDNSQGSGGWGRSYDIPGTCDIPRSSGSPRSCGSPETCDIPRSCGSPRSCDIPRSCGSPRSCDLPRSSDSPRSCGSPRTCDMPRSCGSPGTCDIPRSFGSPRSCDSPRSCGSPGTCDIPRSCDSPRSCGSPRSCDIPSCGSPRSCDIPRSCGSPGSQAGHPRGSPGQEPFPHEDLEAGSIPSPAPFPAQECPPEPWDGCEPSPGDGCEPSPEGSPSYPDPDCAEVGEAEISVSPWDKHRDPLGENLEFSDAEDILPNQDTHKDLALEDPLENPFGDSEQEYFEGNSCSSFPSRSCCIVRSLDAAGARTNQDSSSRSSLHSQEQGQDWDWDIPRDPRSFVVTRQCQERMENLQLPRRRGRRARGSHLAQSLLDTWRGSEEITQNTLDMECLRFHYKLKEILRKGKPPFSTSNSIFPTSLSPSPLSPRSRSPLQVTIPPSDTWPGGFQCHRDPGGSRRGRSRAGSRQPRAPLRLGQLRYQRAVPEPHGDVTGILDEYSQFQRVLLGRAEARRDPLARGEAQRGQAGTGQPDRTVPVQGMVAALHSQLRRVAAGARPGMFYLLETGKEPFFDRVKAVLRAEGFVRTEPPSFCGAQRRGGAGRRLLVIVRNQDISCHIHTVPCLLQLKLCPSVVFAGVDDPQDVAEDTFQELFQAGGFMVSDEELLERVTLAQLQEVVKVLEKLNRNGRWKWLLHHREGKKLRGDLRADSIAQRKQLLLRWCQGEELLELLPFHGCDSATAAEPQRLQCLQELQLQHIHSRFSVYLTENPGSSREILESKGILVADINTFLGTMQKVAAPFRRNYW